MREDLKNALQVLKSGGVILYPTDTIWGLGCDATNSESIKRISQIKNRDDSKALLVLVNSIFMLEQYIEQVPEIAYKLLELSDKPLTIIYPNAKNLPANLVSTDGSIGIRIVKETFCNQLIGQFKKPVVSTSANESGQPSPQNYKEIKPGIISQVDYVVQLNRTDTSKKTPSGIIKIGLKGEIEIIRK